MKRYIYPAIFMQDEKKGYTVVFPDLKGCVTEGDNFLEAYLNAREALALYLDDEENIPAATAAATAIENIKNEGSGVIQLIEADFSEESSVFLNKNVSEIMKKQREKKGYSKYKLAKVITVSESMINRIESGERTPAPEIAKRIADELDFDWRFFYKKTERS